MRAAIRACLRDDTGEIRYGKSGRPYMPEIFDEFRQRPRTDIDEAGQGQGSLGRAVAGGRSWQRAVWAAICRSSRAVGAPSGATLMCN